MCAIIILIYNNCKASLMLLSFPRSYGLSVQQGKTSASVLFASLEINCYAQYLITVIYMYLVLSVIQLVNNCVYTCACCDIPLLLINLHMFVKIKALLGLCCSV